ncbi:SsrA-binding protein SmpB [Alishewanella sp. 16-MA]|uniref:SsrA-binding protein n=1 Tax=Alishewanella maricola TaxID=2795740 RepID=A0ABS8C480_9ALTE|nr:MULTISPECIES: SsrA-binding protein SmpB [Gammaproteobacteria]MDP5036178.1 SsrA-binding protein SmpB [Alishewanella sp.]MCB5227111.1 SsrA-binding protein SmpB [Alishewanella maricola]MCC5452416.1 SsrA-binding protein SmpB [Rheinheimera sp. UJ51]MCF4010237.1 SsrA-binding protein SmpB [Rheinheimera sp. UJ63]MDP5186091.1 SsrA-binding protein SmpB [Alishewanella sp.]
MSKKQTNKKNNGTIAQNRKARHEYFLEERFEAGLSLQGWEVKSIRDGKVNLSDAYVILQDGQAYLFGAQIQPLNNASTHVICDPDRSRKLLLHKRELMKLIGLKERDGYTLIATAMYWKACWVKLEFHLAKGKKNFDKRDDIKDRDWSREKERMMKHSKR